MKLFAKLSILTLVLGFTTLLMPRPAFADGVAINLNIIVSTTPLDYAHNGDVVHYTILVINPIVDPPYITGTATNIVIKLFKPEADGLPNLSGTPWFTDTIATLSPGDTKTYDIPATLALNPGVTVARAEATYIGVITSPTGNTGDSHGTKTVHVDILPNEIPEFGLIPGAIALLSSGAGFVFLKKRNK